MRRLRQISLLIALFLLALGSAYFVGARSKQHEIRDLQSVVSAANQEVKIWKDEAGQSHIRAKAAEVRTNEALRYLAKNDAEFSKIHEEFSRVNKSLKNLHLYASSGSESGIDFTAPGRDTVFRDTIRGKVYNFNNKWYKVRAVITDSLRCSIRSVDTIKQTAYWNRKWLLGRKTYEFEQFSKNPYTTIVWSKVLVVKKKK